MKRGIFSFFSISFVGSEENHNSICSSIFDTGYGDFRTNKERKIVNFDKRRRTYDRKRIESRMAGMEGGALHR